MRYSWNPAKNASNLAKHGISFEAVEAGFEWEHALVIADLRSDEPRLTALAPIGTRLFYLVFTVERRSVRIISFRRASRKEVQRYASEG